MVGIIGEYNPFHNGHLYHLKKVRELFPNETITLVLVGHFLNRGDISTINKWDKTELALTYGVDLVVELPFIFASQSADTYAYGAISILNHLKADYLVFGSEIDNIALLTNLALKLKEDNSLIKKYLKEGYNYPTSLDKAYNIKINTPNDLLGLSYIKAIDKLNSSIKPISIKRTNNYHDKELKGSISSATSLRESLKNNKDISDYIPKYPLEYIKNIALNDYFAYLKYQIIVDDISKYNIDIKLANSIKKNIMQVNSIEELIESVKTKNYTYNSIKRSLVQVLCGIKKEDLKKDISYIRVLGFNNKGQKYLNKIKKGSIPLITNYNKCLDLELKVTKIYSLVYGEDIIKKELGKPILK